MNDLNIPVKIVYKNLDELKRKFIDPESGDIRPSKRRRIESESSDISSSTKLLSTADKNISIATTIQCSHIEKAKLEEFMAECKDSDWSLLNKTWIRTNPNNGEYGTRVFCKYGNGDEYYPATLVEVRSHEIQVIFDDYQMKLKKVLVKKQDVLSIGQIPTGPYGYIHDLLHLHSETYIVVLSWNSDVTLIGRTIFARLGGLGEYSEATILAAYQKTNLLGKHKHIHYRSNIKVILYYLILF